MPSQKELRAAMSKKLQEAIKHPDPTVAAGRKSAIKRWVGVLYDNFMEHIKYFKGDSEFSMYLLSSFTGRPLPSTALDEKLLL